jgi:hypothetical protein
MLKTSAGMTRRAMLAAAAASVLLSNGVPAESAAATTGIDPASPGGRLDTFMMMRGALDDRLVIGFVTGRYYGVVEDRMTPLYGLAAATFSRYRRMADGGFAGVGLEQAYFTDLATGKVLENWLNPYTGDTVSVPVTRTEPSAFTIDRNLRFGPPVETPGVTVDHSVPPSQIVGDDIWFTEQLLAEVQPTGAAAAFHYNELTTMHASCADLRRPGARRVPCETHFSATVGWRPWLKMGDRPGHLLGDGEGRYGVSVENLPPVWVEATRRSRPEIIRDPLGVLEPVFRTL